MPALPLLIALVAAFAIAPAGLRALAERGLARPNYRGRELPYAAGAVAVAAALVALVPLGLIQRAAGGVFEPEAGAVAIYALGVTLLGLVDDALGSTRRGEPGPRGWRGHAAALAAGELSTGALKAAGSLGLACYVLAGQGYGVGRYVLAVLVLVLATNVLNLLDLRPGRSIKALVVLGALLTLGALDARPLAALGLFLGPLLVVGFYDLRERAMLGDTGSNLAGALAGLWLVLTLGTVGLAVALVALAAITVYGELRSLSELIERSPILRQLDALGRHPSVPG